MKWLLRKWDHFWFEPQSPLPLAIFRILFGMMVMQFCVLMAPDLFVWFGSHGIVSSTTVHDWSVFVTLNALNVFPSNDTWLLICFGIFFFAAFFLTIGYHTRISAVLVFLGITTLYHRDPFLFNSGDTYMRLQAFWLIFSGAGEAASIDQLFRNAKANRPAIGEGPPCSPWAQRLLQIQMCLLYAHTFFAKIVGYTWQDGTAVYYASRLEELRRFVTPYLFDHLWTINLLTYFTLIVEASMFSLIWVKPLRYWILFLALILHIGIDVSMSIPQFEWLMMISFVLFIEPKDLRALVNKLGLIITLQQNPISVLFPSKRTEQQ